MTNISLVVGPFFICNRTVSW